MRSSSSHRADVGSTPFLPCRAWGQPVLRGVADRPQPSYVQLPAGSAASLTAREEAALVALCRAVIPGGPMLPAAGPEIVHRLQGLFV